MSNHHTLDDQAGNPLTDESASRDDAQSAAPPVAAQPQRTTLEVVDRDAL